MRSPVHSLWSMRRLVAVNLIFLSNGISALYAQPALDTWQGPTVVTTGDSRILDSSWFTNTNWRAPGVEGPVHFPPTPDQNALVDNGTTAQIGIPPTGTPTASAATLTIGTAVAGSTVQLFGGDLNASSVVIGAHGTFEFSGGFLHTTVSFEDKGGIVLFNTSPSQTLSGLSGSGQLIINGISLTLDGTNTFNGQTIINEGALQIGTGETIGSISGNITNNGTLTFDRSDVLTFAGVISGTGNLIQIGNGTTILAGNNTYTGNTTINAGVLSISQDANLGAAPGTPVANQITMDGGILQATASFTLNSNRGVTLRTGATFDVTDAHVLTIAGTITGPGSLTETGTGTLILSGVNTYTGITTINAGVLSISQDANLGTPPGTAVGNQITFNGGTLQATASFTLNPNRGVTLIGGGTFDITGINALTYGGVITGPGNLTKVGTGTLALAGVNTYSGQTTVSAGVLQARSVGAFSAASAFTVNSGAVLDLNGVDNTVGSLSGSGLVTNTGGFGTSANATLSVGANNTSTAFSGTLQDGGAALALDKIGTATLTLTGNNTYTGGTTISAGTLQIGNGGTTGSIIGNVTNDGILVFDRSDSVTFGGVISGTGSLVKQGAGTLTLPATNSYTGTTTVNAGSLIVDGTIASAQTVVNPGGFLGGRGGLGGSLVNSGIVSPGDSPGTLTVNSNYTQNANGTLRIEVAGLGATQHDLLAVGGHASLAGTLQFVRLGDFNLHVGDKLTFLTANGGVSGSFGTVQNEFLSGTIVKVEVVNLPNAVVLEGTQGSFVPVACTPNAAAVAHALDSAVSDSRSARLISFLDEQPIDQLCGDLQRIAPEQLASIFNIGVSLANVQTANLKRRMEDIRAGSSGFSAAGFTLNGSAQSVSSGFAGLSGPEGKSGPPVFAPTPENRWGVFVTGLGEFTNVDSTPNAPGYDVDTGGFTLGVDYRVTPNFAIGLTGGYAHTSVSPDGGGNIDVNGGKIGLYATVFGNGFYLDTAVSGGPSGYDIRRTALQGTASGSTDGADVDVLVAAGYDWKKGNLTIGPTASFQFNYIGLNGFTETGSLAPLTFPDQNKESERSAFGAKASYDWKIGHVTVIPQINAAWQHEYGSTAYSVVANFASGAGKSFTVVGPDIGRDSLLIGAGATVIWNDRVSTYLYYDGEVARTNYQSHNVSGGVRISF